MQLEFLYHILDNQILTQEWFSRVWVFQELLLSRNAWLQHGSTRFGWQEFCRLYFLVENSLHRLRPDQGKGPKSTLSANRLAAMHRARHRFPGYLDDNDEGISLLELLELRRGLAVSDARDMIYAHLGLACDPIIRRGGFKVDYRKTCVQVFIDTAKYHIEQNKDYRVLSYVEDVNPSRRCQGLPSWVPDWTSNKVWTWAKWTGQDTLDLLIRHSNIRYLPMALHSWSATTI
jgi:hypothetical protein